MAAKSEKNKQGHFEVSMYTTQMVPRALFFVKPYFWTLLPCLLLRSAVCLQLSKPHILTALCSFPGWPCKSCVSLSSHWLGPHAHLWTLTVMWRHPVCDWLRPGLWLFAWFPLHSLLLCSAFQFLSGPLHMPFTHLCFVWWYLPQFRFGFPH